jgi:hypothetical protein
MATTVSHIRDVNPGLNEYTASRQITAVNDVLEVQFNGAVKLEQLVVTTNNSYQVSWVLPGSEKELLILNPVGNKSINGNDNRGQMWYCLPARSKLKLRIDSAPSSETLTMTILATSM